MVRPVVGACHARNFGDRPKTTTVIEPASLDAGKQQAIATYGPWMPAYMNSRYGYTASGSSDACPITRASVCEYRMVTGSGS